MSGCLLLGFPVNLVAPTVEEQEPYDPIDRLCEQGREALLLSWALAGDAAICSRRLIIIAS